MVRLLPQITLLAAISLAACNQPDTTPADLTDGGVDSTEARALAHAEWSYEGETAPEHWVEIETESACGGERQSPIDIIDTKAEGTDAAAQALEVMYARQTPFTEIINNGHTIKFRIGEGDSIRYGGQVYHLRQLHFHEPSEHTINGVRYPIEIHLVHLNADQEITVLGIMGQEGNPSELMEYFRRFLPIGYEQSETVEDSLDLNTLFPKSRTYFTYGGSLTTPPCTEGVNWVIFKQPMRASSEEIAAIKKSMPLNNYREKQGLNGRQVWVVE